MGVTTCSKEEGGGVLVLVVVEEDASSFLIVPVTPAIYLCLAIKVLSSLGIRSAALDELLITIKTI